MTHFFRTTLFLLSILLLASCQKKDASKILEQVQLDCQNHNWDEAAYALEGIKNLGTENPRIYAIYAYVQNKRGVTEEADKYIYKANPVNSNDSEVLTMIPRIHIERGEFAEAIKMLNDAFRIEPDNKITLQLLMWAEFQKYTKPDGDFDLEGYSKNARAVVYMMARKHMRDAVFYNHAAVKHYMTTGDNRFIMPFLNTALKRDSSNPVTLLNLAVVYDQMFKHKSNARFYYSKYLKRTSPSDPLRNSVEHRIQQLQGLSQ